MHKNGSGELSSASVVTGLCAPMFLLACCQMAFLVLIQKPTLETNPSTKNWHLEGEEALHPKHTLSHSHTCTPFDNAQQHTATVLRGNTLPVSIWGSDKRRHRHDTHEIEKLMLVSASVSSP